MPQPQATREPVRTPVEDGLIHEELLYAVNPDNRRGMQDLLDGLPADALRRAALGLLASRQEVLILTGFPVSGQAETDGPAGAVALYRALRRIGRPARIASWPAVLEALQTIEPGLAGCAVPLPGSAHTSCLPPADFVLLSIEVCGRTRDGRHCNMRGEDISGHAPDIERLFGEHALIAIGDGGNEFGMGAAPASFFERWPVVPPASTCDYLIPAAISNDGAYALLAALEVLSGHECLLPSEYEALLVLEQLHAAGFVDGYTGEHRRAVDGLPFVEALAALRRLRAILTRHRCGSPFGDPEPQLPS